jgi:transcriptional regulator with XRE-family HTH domain
MAKKYEIWDNDKIKLAREISKMSLEEAAIRLDIHENYLRMIEGKTKQPGPSLIGRMADEYGQPIAFFLKSEKNLALA